MQNIKLKVKIDRHYFIFILFLYFFLFKDWMEKVIPFISMADEVIAILAIPVLIIQICQNGGIVKIEKKGGYFRWVVLLTLVGLLGNLVYKYQPMKTAVLPDLLVSLKFWLCILVGKFIFSSTSLDKNARQILGHIKFIVWIYTVLIVIDNIHPIFISEYRYGMKSTQLFYKHPTVFVACCVLLMTVLLLIRNNIRRRDEIIYGIWISVLMCTTLRSKAFGCVLVFWLIYYAIMYKKRKFHLRTLFVILPLIVLMGWNQIQFYFFSSIQDDSARYQLLIKSFEVANDHFPLGSGLGTFGSYFSGEVYSPLYRMYGLSNVYGLTESAPDFISDSYWPMILGQYGWIGTIFMLLALYALFKQVQRVKVVSASYYAAGLYVIAYLLIESTASSAFVHPLSIPLALILGYIMNLARKVSLTNQKGNQSKKRSLTKL